MMDSLNLQWNAFPEHLKLMSKELYEEERYFDITLVSDDQFQFKAHKIILSACSPVFRNIIDYNPTQNSLIYLRGVQSQELEPILQFMYLGEGKLSYERMGLFLKVAKDLQVKEININGEVETEENNFENKRETIRDGIKEENTNLKIHKFVESGLSSGGYQAREENSQENSHEETTFASGKADFEATELIADPTYFQTQLGTKLELKFPTLKQESKQLYCTECDFQTLRKQALKKHVEGQHEGIKYPCTECAYTATQIVNLRRHLLSKHDVARYSCSQCVYQATEENLLEKHLKVKHSNRRKGVYSCDKCDYEAWASSSLWYHKNAKHSS